MADLLTENILPVLGLCPPGSLLLPWLGSARDGRGRPMELPVRSCSATFAVARRVAQREAGRGQAPVAAVLLEGKGPSVSAVPTTLVMLDWVSELSPYSGGALRNSDPRGIFGSDVQIERRCLLALCPEPVMPQPVLRGLSERLGLDPQQIGWISLRALYDVLLEYLVRIPRERWRAPERTAVDLVDRLEEIGIHGFRVPPLPTPELVEYAAQLLWRYERLRPGAREFPWRFLPDSKICDEALVLEARLQQRRREAQKAGAAATTTSGA